MKVSSEDLLAYELWSARPIHLMMPYPMTLKEILFWSVWGMDLSQ